MKMTTEWQLMAMNPHRNPSLKAPTGQASVEMNWPRKCGRDGYLNQTYFVSWKLKVSKISL